MEVAGSSTRRAKGWGESSGSYSRGANTRGMTRDKKGYDSCYDKHEDETDRPSFISFPHEITFLRWHPRMFGANTMSKSYSYTSST